MPFDLPTFLRLRPVLYHLTATTNIARIRESRRLVSAAALLESANQRRLISERRPNHLRIAVESAPIHIRDQHPLFAGNIALEGGWSFARLVEELNQRVFFWPCKSTPPHLPSDYGQRHFARYAAEDCKVLVIDTAALFAANAPAAPEFCAFNSGSPRCSPISGKSPRGPDTFLPAERFPRNPGEVVEVTFRQHVQLPPAAYRIAEPSEFYATS